MHTLTADQNKPEPMDKLAQPGILCAFLRYQTHLQKSRLKYELSELRDNCFAKSVPRARTVRQSKAGPKMHSPRHICTRHRLIVAPKGASLLL
jgi:hypothetical protein